MTFCCYFHYFSVSRTAECRCIYWVAEKVGHKLCDLQTANWRKTRTLKFKVDGQVLCTWRENLANDRTFLHQTPKDHVPVQWSWVVLTLMVTNQYGKKRLLWAPNAYVNQSLNAITEWNIPGCIGREGVACCEVSSDREGGRMAGVSGLGGGSVDRVVTRVEPTWPAYVLKLCNCWLLQTFHFAQQWHQQPASYMDQRTNQKVLKALSHSFVFPFCTESIIGIALFDVLICFLILQFSQSELMFVSGTSWE